MKVQTCQFLCRSSKFKPPQIKLSELFYYDILSQETGDDLGELRCTPTSDLSLNPAVLSWLLDDLVLGESLQHTIITRAHKSTQNLSKQHYICWNRRYRSPVEKATASMVITFVVFSLFLLRWCNFTAYVISKRLHCCRMSRKFCLLKGGCLS